MPAGRPRNNAKHLNAAVDDLLRAIDKLVGKLGRSSERAARPAATPRKAGKRGPGKGNMKLHAAWANYTPKQRAARIAAMRAGHARRKRAAQGAAPKRAAAPLKTVVRRAPRVVRPQAGGGWASMSPEQRAERMAKMRAGRAVRPSATPAAVANSI